MEGKDKMDQDTVKLGIIAYHNAELPNVRVRFQELGKLAFRMEVLGTQADYQTLANHVRAGGHGVELQFGAPIDGPIWRYETLVTVGA